MEKAPRRRTLYYVWRLDGESFDELSRNSRKHFSRFRDAVADVEFRLLNDPEFSRQRVTILRVEAVRVAERDRRGTTV